MRKTVFLQIIATGIILSSASAFAQLGQLNGGNAGGAGNIQTNDGAGNAPGSAASGGGTTDGPGGVTTEGPGSSAAQDGGIAGGNRTEVFVGGNNAGGFVGGGLVESAFNSNRLFRAIAESQLTTGTSAETSGTPRRVPVSLKVAFNYPKASGTDLLQGNVAAPIVQISQVRPELRDIALTVDPAGIATLSGTAPTPAAARLAANLVRLQPGIRKVDNQIQVAVR